MRWIGLHSKDSSSLRFGLPTKTSTTHRSSQKWKRKKAITWRVMPQTCRLSLTRQAHNRLRCRSSWDRIISRPWKRQTSWLLPTRNYSSTRWFIWDGRLYVWLIVGSPFHYLTGYLDGDWAWDWFCYWWLSLWRYWFILQRINHLSLQHCILKNLPIQK